MGKRQKVRTAIQVCWTALSNGHMTGFLQGKLYTGPMKTLCVPGLNCYSCPGALGACPLGALQSTLADRRFKFAFYAVGFFLLFGAVLGRFVCGFLCPFGLLQDLLYKIPLPKSWKKRKLLPGDRVLKWLKWVLLVLFCILLPLVAVYAVIALFYLLSATGAFAYAGLLDYRAKMGAIRPALVWSEKSPEQDAERVAKALRVSEETLRR